MRMKNPDQPDVLTTLPAPDDVRAELTGLRQLIGQLLPKSAPEFKIGDRVCLIRTPDMVGTVVGQSAYRGRILVQYDHPNCSNTTALPGALQLFVPTSDTHVDRDRADRVDKRLKSLVIKPSVIPGRGWAGL
jgi:hypothetical protein